MKKITSVLIANRGEPVKRATRTLRRMGLKVITVATSEDLSQPWIATSDHVNLIPSYLDAAAIIEAARASKADAIWPAWGFLSENASFAKLVTEAGLTWIGPSPHVIEIMGSKSEATKAAIKAGLKTIPEVVIDGESATAASLALVEEACAKMGFPVLFKPALGGGGQGQEIVHDARQIKSAWENVCVINARQFQQGPVLVQRYFTEARHIEAQVLADQHGHAVIMGERDCSIQRRNQKVIEEAPSPAMTTELRQTFISDSLKLIRSIGYDNAGTIEYLFEGNQFYFLEMNTRLQVEHTVTEETARVSGKKIDLLEEMINSASGETLKFNQDQIILCGHAIEARIYAEDPVADFRPTPGKVDFVKFCCRENVRIESAMGETDGFISPSFDPMIAKIIVCEESREQAILHLKKSLRETVILGVTTNLSFCDELLDHEKFIEGDYTTRFISQNKQLRGETPASPGLAIAIAAALRYAYDTHQARQALFTSELTSLIHVCRLIPKNGASYQVELCAKSIEVSVRETAPSRFKVAVGDLVYTLTLKKNAAFGHTVILGDTQVVNTWSLHRENALQLSLNGDWYRFKIKRDGDNTHALDPHASPMTGQIVTILVNPGDKIELGQDLYQIESMKMVTTIRASYAGLVEAVMKKVGEPIKTGESALLLPREDQSEVLDQAKIWQSGELGRPLIIHEAAPLERVAAIIAGFDADKDDFENLAGKVRDAVQSGAMSKEKMAAGLAKILAAHFDIKTLFTEHAHAITYLAERGSHDGEHLPKPTLELLRQILPSYELKQIADLDQNAAAVIHLFQAYQQDRSEKSGLLTALVTLCYEENCLSPDLTAPIVRWVKDKTEAFAGDREILIKLLYKLDVEKFYEVGRLPVAVEYLAEFHAFNKDPLVGLERASVDRLADEILTGTKSNSGGAHDYRELPEKYRTHFKRWFADFDARAITLPKHFSELGLTLIELNYSSKGVAGKIAPRFVVTARMTNLEIKTTPGGLTSMPGVERAAIEAYRLLRIIQGMAPHEPNHVFLLSDTDTPVRWKTRDDESSEAALTPELARKIAARVGGFSAEVRLQATEVALPLIKVNTKAEYFTIIEVRHAKPYGIISRPPFVIDERQPEVPLDAAAQANANQQRMGKLINPDRAMLLFDEGVYKELKFPEVDDAPGIGLAVFEGTVCGKPVLAYASDFRVRGGALGEREGKKLATSVALAYVTNRPLVGFHDGAGANIKESIASLGWAGAYFGAIANTGGFSSREQFCRWLTGHCERAYFEKVFGYFGLGSDVNHIVDGVKHQLKHFHLHVGATVGMLVYGASISHLSLMNDQPESYRVLTGAATVARVMGEESSNYELGGAKVHGEESGDIDMAFSSEEQVINNTRRLIKMFGESERTQAIVRAPEFVPMGVPTQGSLILSRAALKANLDHGEFFETRSTLKHASALITGYASVAGHTLSLVCMATDYGISHDRGFKKATQQVNAAQDLGVPLVFVAGDHWEAPSTPVPAAWIAARAELIRAVGSLTVPRVSLALGPRAIEKSIHTHMDIAIYVKRGTETDFELERVKKIGAIIADNLQMGFDKLALVLGLLSKQSLEKDSESDSPTRASNVILPNELNIGYEMRDAISEVFDKSSFFELWQEDKLPLLAGFARLNGQTVAVIADNPLIEGGAQNVDSIAKFTRLNRLAAKFNLPIIELNDSPAFRPGSEQEHGGIQGEGGKSIREECLSNNPKIAVTLRQNYGGRFIHANLVTLGPKRAGLILDNAKVGVMGAKGAVTVLYRKKLAALPENERKLAYDKYQKDYEDNQLNPQNAVNLGYVKKPIRVTDLRGELIKTLREIS